jgi:phosphoribosylaminoimidazolecarboxamide formyltransferase/IMP cyclohydrolase
MTAVPRRALLSCSNKTGLVEFARRLVELGFELVSTGGTRAALQQAGLPVTDIAEYTGFPEMMDGRLKTLHPKVHGGLLGRLDHPDDVAAMQAHGILPFELVVVNLYPFAETIARPGVTVEQAIEQIDIGGPSMVRAAAKNHARVAVVTSPAQYERVLAELEQGGVSAELRRDLAGAAFELTARYDRAIADYFAGLHHKETEATDFPSRLQLSFDRRALLRYGENPHQRAAFYAEPAPAASTLAAAEVLHGKELSYNNLLDLDAALQIIREFAAPAAVVIKHNNPCGCAVANTLAEAYDRADAGDPVSAFGSILGFNRPVDLDTADQLCVPGRFIEAIIAPDYLPEAFQVLTSRPKWKANVRLLRCPALLEPRPVGMDYRRITGGLLVQDRDDATDPQTEWRVVTPRHPTPEELADLQFAWKVCKHVKSNAVLFAKQQMVVGVGAGQMSRLDAAYMASHKAGDRARGAVCASDAFFPFRDGIDQIAQAGITAVIQPGGSKKDEEVIAACQEHRVAMIFTGRRHFRH